MALPNTSSHVSSRPEARFAVGRNRQHGVSDLACSASFPWPLIDLMFVWVHMRFVSISLPAGTGWPMAHVHEYHGVVQSRIKHEKQHEITLH